MPRTYCNSKFRSIDHTVSTKHAQPDVTFKYIHKTKRVSVAERIPIPYSATTMSAHTLVCYSKPRAAR